MRTAGRFYGYRSHDWTGKLSPVTVRSVLGEMNGNEAFHHLAFGLVLKEASDRKTPDRLVTQTEILLSGFLLLWLGDLAGLLLSHFTDLHLQASAAGHNGCLVPVSIFGVHR